MNSGWQECKLGEICTDISYGYTESANSKAVGPKFLRITDIVPDRIYWDKVPYCVADKQVVDKYKLQNGDIVIARTGATTGYNKIIKNIDFDAIFASYLIRYQIDTTKAYPQYIGHILQSSTWYDYIDAIAGGSAQPGANAKELGSFVILLPTLSEQRAIAGVLSSLDDKIDLLHRQNKTLEGMAETLWRKMFVEEADPGWETTTIGDVATINGKSIDKECAFTDIEYLDTGSLTEGRISEFQYLQFKDAPSRARRIVQNNDIIISMVRPIQKHYGILKKVKHNTIVSTGFVVITCIKVDPHFIYVLLTQKEMTEYLDIIAEASTTTYPSFVPSDIAKIDFLKPPTELMQQFSEYAGHIWDKIEGNNAQIRTLSHLRDTLLPKLMSGEVRVKL